MTKYTFSHGIIPMYNIVHTVCNQHYIILLLSGLTAIINKILK